MAKKKKTRVRKKLKESKLMEQLRELQPEWTPFKPASLAPEDLERYKGSAAENETLEGVLRNSRYQVLVFHVEVEGIPGGEMNHLSIKRLDRETVHDWRDMQRIKNEICGSDREAVELYPREDRLVDTSNQYHLWVLPEEILFPFGYDTRAVADSELIGNKQRPFEDRPEDALSDEDIKEGLRRRGYEFDEDKENE